MAGDLALALYLDRRCVRVDRERLELVDLLGARCGAGGAARLHRTVLQRRRGAPRWRARRYISAGTTSWPRSQPDRSSTETPSFLASGASPPQSCNARERACI